MSYYNPKIYNYSNLHEEDKEKVKVIKQIFIDPLESPLDLDFEQETILEKMKTEIRTQAFEDAQQLLYDQLIEYMVCLIDSYEQDEPIDEIDTDDYFYGLDY